MGLNLELVKRGLGNTSDLSLFKKAMVLKEMLLVKNCPSR